MLAEVQVGVAPPTVEPEAACGIAVTKTHGNKANMGGVMLPGPKRSGDELTLIADGSGPDRIAVTVLASRHEIRPVWTGPSLR